MLYSKKIQKLKIKRLKDQLEISRDEMLDESIINFVTNNKKGVIFLTSDYELLAKYLTNTKKTEYNRLNNQIDSIYSREIIENIIVRENFSNSEITLGNLETDDGDIITNNLPDFEIQSNYIIECDYYYDYDPIVNNYNSYTEDFKILILYDYMLNEKIKKINLENL